MSLESFVLIDYTGGNDQSSCCPWRGSQGALSSLSFLFHLLFLKPNQRIYDEIEEISKQRLENVLRGGGTAAVVSYQSSIFFFQYS